MVSEFRQDIVSGHWVLISTLRGKRPEHKRNDKFYQPKDGCPFEDPQATKHGEPLLVYNQGKKIEWAGPFAGPWTTQVIKNKYPALESGPSVPIRHVGPFFASDAIGCHELVITKDHDRHFATFSEEETAEIIAVYQERYKAVAQDESAAYVLVFHNHGPASGGTLYHNHSQILSTPVLPPHIAESLEGSHRYAKNQGRSPHAVIIEWEREEQKRVVYENESFIVFCPFASKSPYEMRIFPKASYPYFEHVTAEDVLWLADALNTALKKLFTALDDPDYNFYIHTAPAKKDPLIDHTAYSWHIEIIPRLPHVANIGAVELGTAIYINPIDPDEAAEHLRTA